MEKIILYVDDVAYAREHLDGLSRMVQGADSTAQRHWVLVACAPRMTRRISKWVSHSARENWRGKWFAKVQGELMPLLQAEGDQVTPLLADGPLPELTQQLQRTHGAATVIDARRPRVGVDLEQVAPDAPPTRPSGWALPGAVVGLAALFVVVNGLAIGLAE